MLKLNLDKMDVLLVRCFLNPDGGLLLFVLDGLLVPLRTGILLEDVWFNFVHGFSSGICDMQSHLLALADKPVIHFPED